MTDERQLAHPTSVAVWGVPSPVAAASRFTATVGVKCSAGCPLAGHPVVIRDETGRELGRGTLGTEPAAGTRALYAAAVALTAPPEPGVHAWTAAFPGGAAEPPVAGATAQPEIAPDTATEAQQEPAAAPRHEPATTPQQEPAAAPRHEATSAPQHEATSAPRHEATSAPQHEAAASTFSFRTVEPPEHAATVSVTVVDGDTESPLANADVRLGLYRASTDAKGDARIEAPAGAYELYVRRPGYAPYAAPVTVTGDAALRVAAARVTDADLDDDQVWM